MTEDLVTRVYQRREALHSFEEATAAVGADDYERAERCLWQAGKLAEDLGMSALAAECAERLGAVYAMQDRYDEAERAVKAALAYNETDAERATDVATCLQALANIYMLTERQHLAEANVLKAGAIFIAQRSFGQLLISVDNLVVIRVFRERADADQSLARCAVLKEMCRNTEVAGVRDQLTDLRAYLEAHGKADLARTVALEVAR